MYCWDRILKEIWYFREGICREILDRAGIIIFSIKILILLIIILLFRIKIKSKVIIALLGISTIIVIVIIKVIIWIVRMMWIDRRRICFLGSSSNSLGKISSSKCILRAVWAVRITIIKIIIIIIVIINKIII